MSAEIYKEMILDHYRHPRNYGELPNADARAREANVICGDTIEMQVKLDEEIVQDVKFRGQGCAISIASASRLTEVSKGKPISEVRKLGRNDIVSLLGADPGPARIECALLALKVLKMAICSHLGIKPPQETDWQ